MDSLPKRCLNFLSKTPVQLLYLTLAFILYIAISLLTSHTDSPAIEHLEKTIKHLFLTGLRDDSLNNSTSSYTA